MHHPTWPVAKAEHVVRLHCGNNYQSLMRENPQLLNAKDHCVLNRNSII